MSAIPTASFSKGFREIGEASGHAFKQLAQRTRNGLGHADEVVKAHGGFKGSAVHFWKEKPVTTGVVAASTVAGTAVIGGNMLRSLGETRSQERGR